MAQNLPRRLSGGLFVSLEGGEGSGKSTLLDRLAEFLAGEGYAVLITREPGGPPIAEAIRTILLDPSHAGMDPLTELFLYLGSRRQNLQERIQPHLDAGGVVLCDRFSDASVAYQGGGRGLGLERVERLNTEAIGTARPDLTFLLDLAPEAGLARKLGTGAAATPGDRLEREALDFHRRVREAYREWAARHPQRIRILDAARPPGEVAATALAALREALAARAAD
ncbi:MAG: dTMP kinase [Candidatus Krumholzibacteriota bacterium]|nr:dTMP kinase [Candidatus Krumholzibacteriota bacterium]